MQAVAIVDHRFGCSETGVRALQGDPRGWQAVACVDALAGPTDLSRA